MPRRRSRRFWWSTTSRSACIDNSPRANRARRPRAEYRRWLEFERAWLKIYDGVWTVSEEDRRVAVRESGRSAERRSTFRTASISTASGRRTAGRREEIFYVGSFRHLPNTIGFEKLEREVMPRVWKQFPEARLRVVAGPRYEQFWKKRPLDARIELHGFVEDLRPLYGERGGGRGSAGGVGRHEHQGAGGDGVREAGGHDAGRVRGARSARWSRRGDSRAIGSRSRRPSATCWPTERYASTIGARARATTEERFSWTAIAERAYESYCAVNVAVETLPGSV